jgi:selenide,water dikinase
MGASHQRIMQDIQLTQQTNAGGCGCKIAPQQLHEILQGHRSTNTGPHLLVGNEGNDDAAVMVWEGEDCLVHTTDFFMPIVDDPYDFGRIAATNALSDVWAMGGKPQMALAILGWPVATLGTASASRVMQGARDVCERAGVALAGGHSIETQEPIFGLSVTGRVSKSSLKRNNTAQLGDVLYITKPLGVGVMATAFKRGIIDAATFAPAIESMTQSNAFGAKAGELHGVTAMTDVTGFGLVGHLMEMIQDNDCTAVLDMEKIPILAAALPLIQQSIYADMAMKTYSKYAAETNIAAMAQLIPLFDPQTSGGLMLAVKPQDAQSLELLAQENGQVLYAIGRLEQRGEKRIMVL